MSLRGPTSRAVAISFFKALFLFNIGILGLIWHSDFGISNCADLVAPVSPVRKNKWQTDETNRVYFNNSIGRSRYEKELLNFRKDSHFYKTNHLRLHRVSPPALTTRKNEWQTGETNRVHVRLKRAGANLLTYEKELLNSKRNNPFAKTNHPGKGNNGGLGGLMEDPTSTRITAFFAYMPGMAKKRGH